MSLAASDIFEGDVLRLGSRGDALFRVIGVFPDRAILFELEAQTHAPLSALSWRELEADQSITFCDEHIFNPPAFEPEFSSRRKNARERVHAILTPLIELGDEIFDERRRSKVISAIVSPNDGGRGYDRKTVKKTLDRYWRFGMTLEAAVPTFENIGGPGVKKTRGDKKLGTPRKYGTSPGVNITPDIQVILRIGLRKYYLKNRRMNFSQARIMILKEFCMNSRVDPETHQVVHDSKPLYKEDGFPSVRQISYFYKNEMDDLYVKRERVGRRKYDRDYRGGTGSASRRTSGPGSRYEIDATIANIYAVSRMNNNVVIGRPVIYVIIDVFSKMIVGIYVGLEGPSWIGAMMALVNMVSPKAEFCAQYGLQIEDHEWPTQHLPEKLLGDRGEISKRTIEHLLHRHHVTIESPQAGRPDWKGTVEKSFDLLDCEMRPHVDGYVQPDFGERGAPNYVLDACWTVDDVTEAMIEIVLRLNNSRKLTDYKRTKEMIADGVSAVPIELWEWGVARRVGRLRNCSPERMMFSVMPTSAATFSRRGLHFRGLYYLCDKAILEKWTDRAKQKNGWGVTISYDPRLTSYVYLHDASAPEGYHVCSLAEGSEAYAGVTFAEAKRAIEDDRHDTAYREERQLVESANTASRLQEINKRAQGRRSGASRKPRDVKDRRERHAEEKEENRVGERFDLNAQAALPRLSAGAVVSAGVKDEEYDFDVSEPSIFKIIGGDVADA